MKCVGLGRDVYSSLQNIVFNLLLSFTVSPWSAKYGVTFGKNFKKALLGLSNVEHSGTCVLAEELWLNPAAARFPAQPGNSGCSALQQGLTEWAGNLA